jgi:hypothetical protein
VEAAAEEEQAADKEAEKPKQAKKDDDEEDDAIPIPEEDVNFTVRTEYTRNYQKAKQKLAAATGGLQKCPITGQMVPAEDMTQHLKVVLLDPKWKKQKDQLLERARRESAFDDNVEANLAGFVTKRPDLFGDIEDQIRMTGEMNAEAGAREAGADAGPAHKFSAGAEKSALADQNLLPLPLREVPQDDDDFAALQDGPGGLMALPSGQEAMQPSALVRGVDMTPFAGQDDDEDDDGEPDAKKPRLDLVPEEEFLQRSPPIVKLIVQVLGAEMTGVSQTLTVEVGIRGRVGELKGLLQAQGCTIPVARLKLYHQEKRMVLKDSNSLAFYNLVGGTVLEAKQQERGGRKK